MPRQRTTVFTTIRTEGGLLPAELLAGVAAQDKAIPGLSTADYHLVKGETLGNRITESWNRLTAAWKDYTTRLAALPADDQGTTLTRERWLLLLFNELDYGRLQTAKALDIDGKQYAVSHGWGSVPIHLVGSRTPLDRRTAGVKGAAGASPHSLVQEVLNRSSDHLWAFVSNGLQLRILRDNASLTRQAFIEFDLETMFADGVYDDFVVLWLACHQSRIEAENPTECWLERWTKTAAEQGTRARDNLRAGVEAAIEALGAGFVAHPANAGLKERLRTGELPTHDYYRQLLRLIYRLLFLFVAEDRNLLHPPTATDEQRRRYARYYSIARVRTFAGRRRGGPHPDLWDSLVVVFNGLGAIDGIPALGLPALGSFLWSPAATPDLDSARIANQALLAAIRGVAFVEDANERVLRPVDYRNLGSEELGAIYESLLEQHPIVNADAGTFSLNTAAGNERKTTGSYYTPTSLITELLDSAVDPVLAEAAGKANPEEAILALRAIDPAIGSGHFMIAAAHRIAKRLAAVRTGDDEPSPDATRTALRDVIGRCIYGIDLNPMAVELCKVSLWMESMEPGKPLGFLDHHIVQGNGLIGATPELLEAGVPDDAFKPLIGDDKAVITGMKQRNKQARSGQTSIFGGLNSLDLSSIVSTVEQIDAEDDTSLDAVRTKAIRWSELVASADYQNAVHAADTWCAAFFANKTKADIAITQEDYAIARDNPGGVPASVRATVDSLADQYAFLHWHLAFPDVHQHGGFDVVLGNPPWERIALEDHQFFATRAPEVLEAGTTDARKRAISRLLAENEALRGEYEAARRMIETQRHFFTESGRFPCGAVGRLNTFGLFADIGRQVASRGGSVGLVLPSAILTDVPFQTFISSILEEGLLRSFIDFENRLPLFPAVDSRFRFGLLTLRRSSGAGAGFRVAFGLTDPRVVNLDEVSYVVEPDDLAVINPRTRQLPSCPTPRDFALLLSIHKRCKSFADESHRFQARAWVALTSEAASGLFLGEPAADRVPVYEAKMIHQFNSAFATYEGVADSERKKGNARLIGFSPQSTPLEPRYWVERSVWSDFTRDKAPTGTYLAIRDITNSTNERTTIVALLDSVAAVQPLNGITVAGSDRDALIILAALNSFALDYVSRLKLLGTHLNVTTFSQLPAPPADLGVYEDAVLECVAALCGEAAASLSLKGSSGRAAARVVIGSEGWWQLRHRLDANMFKVYGYERGDVEHIMDTFPIVRRKDETAHGEYRTKRLILEYYDALESAAGSSVE